MRARLWTQGVSLVAIATATWAGLLGGALVATPDAYAQARAGGRLSQLIQNKATLYLPARLLLGQENRILVKAAPGAKVIVYFSPQNQGFVAPNGQALRVGPKPEELQGVASEKGVAALTLALPALEKTPGQDDDEPTPARVVYMDAVTYQKEDFSDMTGVEIVGPTGRVAASNETSLATPTDGKGALFFPGMPGMSGDLIRRLSTLGDLQNGDPRKRELIDDGTRHGDVSQDRNVFIRRPDQLSKP